MSESDAANTTVLSPNKTKITGVRQHKLANTTGIPVIFKISFQFIFIENKKTFKKHMKYNIIYATKNTLTNKILKSFCA